MPLHLYLHMPFCRRRCPYCDFFKAVPSTEGKARFLPALESEISFAAADSRWAGNSLNTVYLGGGTPSLHSPEEIAHLILTIREAFPLEKAAEITIEANPGTLSPEVLKAWREAGINRLSLGAQSFSPRKLQILFRDHTVSEIYSAMEAARTVGFANISLDLIFGVPGETLEEWNRDLSEALALQPEHVSLYNLEYHEHTPFFRWRETGRTVPLSEDYETEMYILTHRRLCESGFEHYEVSNFARPGFRSRHNSAYWEGKPYLGFGPSAHSFDGQTRRWSNVADLNLYYNAISEGRLPIESELSLTPREQREEWLSLALRRSEGVAWDDAVHRLGEDQSRALWKRAQSLTESLREITPQRLSLTAEGWFRENGILLFLFEALNPSPDKMSNSIE